MPLTPLYVPPDVRCSFPGYYQGQIRKGLNLKIALSSSRFHMYVEGEAKHSLSSHQSTPQGMPYVTLGGKHQQNPSLQIG